MNHSRKSRRRLGMALIGPHYAYPLRHRSFEIRFETEEPGYEKAYRLKATVRGGVVRGSFWFVRHYTHATHCQTRRFREAGWNPVADAVPFRATMRRSG